MDEQQNIIIYRTADGRASVTLYAKDGKIWLNQQQMAQLFATSKQTISYHIINILKERELNKNSVVKEYLITAADGKNYNVVFYSLEMIIAVGYRVRGVRGTQFRQWATEHLTEYLVKGFTMDDDRLKNPDGRPDYFDELLAPYPMPKQKILFVTDTTPSMPSASNSMSRRPMPRTSRC